MNKRQLCVLLIALCLSLGTSDALAAKGQLKAGSGKMTITPKDPDKPINDICYARTLILEVNDLRRAFIAVDLGIYTSDSLVATCKKKYDLDQVFLSSSTWYQGTWPNDVPDVESAARGGYGADIDGPALIAVGSGEAMINKHLENYYCLTGLMREKPGPFGFKPESR